MGTEERRGCGSSVYMWPLQAVGKLVFLSCVVNFPVVVTAFSLFWCWLFTLLGRNPVVMEMSALANFEIAEEKPKNPYTTSGG
jgi:hypothetical protein